MAEIRNIQSQQADQRCPACGNGWMRPNGVVETTNPPQYGHACNVCGYQQTYGMRFPYTV